jgi:hypothetical protein
MPIEMVRTVRTWASRKIQGVIYMLGLEAQARGRKTLKYDAEAMADLQGQ